MAEEHGYEDIVTMIRDVDEKLKLAACKNITISEENESLFNAIDEGRDADVLAILDQNPDVLDACQKNAGSVIFTAASRGRYALVQELLNREVMLRISLPTGPPHSMGQSRIGAGRARRITMG